MAWIVLILSMQTDLATTRMRAWRALKASGAAVLRDGVYLMPDRDGCRDALRAVASDVRNGAGGTHLFRAKSLDGTDYPSLFDRSGDYAALLQDIGRAGESISPDAADAAVRQARKCRRAFAAIAATDFFAGEAQRQAEAALLELEQSARRALAPGEPQPIDVSIATLQIRDFQGRTWATRRRPWVDRLACAWLIRRFIDRRARILWLKAPADCPRDALGFDFDGARFSHVGARVTFEVLLTSFGLEQAALKRIGALVHYLDVGGVQPAEAAGIEGALAGMREAIDDDDRLVKAASLVFDGLLSHFEGKEPGP
jgi:hypothetical protein